MAIIVNGDSVNMQYEIPPEYDTKIPDYFYFAMAGELCSIFGPHLFDRIDPVEYDDDGNPLPSSISEGAAYYDLDTSSVGWVEALKATCQKLDMMWLMNYRNELEWYDSDIFDGIIEERIIEKFVKEKTHQSNAYYKYLISKNR